MLLAIDIGNTGVLIGVFSDDAIKPHWRISSVKERTSDEYGIEILALFESAGFDKEVLHGAAMSCVVPRLCDTFNKAISKYLGIEPIIIGPGIKTGMPILTDNPREVGSDRIVNAVGAYEKHQRELIVVDFGTAVTFDYVSTKGEYCGGAIAPGIEVAADALFSRAAKLPRVEIEAPERAIGKNTIESIKSGIFYGFVGVVESVVSRIKRETNGEPLVIATGGQAAMLAEHIGCIDEYDEFLVLKGLKKIYEVNQSGRRELG